MYKFESTLLATEQVNKLEIYFLSFQQVRSSRGLRTASLITLRGPWRGTIPDCPGFSITLSWWWVIAYGIWESLLCSSLMRDKFGNFLVVLQLIHRPTRTKIGCTTNKKLPNLSFFPSLATHPFPNSHIEIYLPNRHSWWNTIASERPKMRPSQTTQSRRRRCPRIRPKKRGYCPRLRKVCWDSCRGRGLADLPLDNLHVKLYILADIIGRNLNIVGIGCSLNIASFGSKL